MPLVMRISIDLPPVQLQALDRYCVREHVSRAEAVRRAVSQFLGGTAKADLPPGFGGWKHRRADGRRQIETLRAEFR